MYDTFDEKYHALQNRSPDAENHFVYVVLSTKIVCRPTCSARLALRKNIDFYDCVQSAIKDGFRPCKRCKPETVKDWNPQRVLVLKIMEQITNMVFQGKSEKDLNLGKLAKQFTVSKWHMLRVFKRYTGKTPLQYFMHVRDHGSFVDIPMIETKKSYINKQLESLLGDTGNGELVGELKLGSNGDLEFLLPSNVSSI